MTPQQTEKIFEPFQSSFEGGTGLGLAVVYQIVQAHEGKVWARSKPGQGTTFILKLHRLEAERQTAKRDLEKVKSAGMGKPVELGAPELMATQTVALAAAAAEGRARG